MEATHPGVAGVGSRLPCDTVLPVSKESAATPPTISGLAVTMRAIPKQTSSKVQVDESFLEEMYASTKVFGPVTMREGSKGTVQVDPDFIEEMYASAKATTAAVDVGMIGSSGNNAERSTVKDEDQSSKGKSKGKGKGKGKIEGTSNMATNAAAGAKKDRASKRKQITKSSIGLPQEFQHIEHMATAAETMFEADEVAAAVNGSNWPVQQSGNGACSAGMSVEDIYSADPLPYTEDTSVGSSSVDHAYNVWQDPAKQQVRLHFFLVANTWTHTKTRYVWHFPLAHTRIKYSLVLRT